MKNIITIGALTYVIFNPNACAFSQSNKQEKAPLLPEIAYREPSKEVKNTTAFDILRLPSMEYAFHRESTQKKRYNRNSKQTKFF
jgi:hypothetical protein